MDIRSRCGKIIHRAPVGQRIRYYQARYDENRFRQIVWLMRMGIVQKSVKMPKKCFVDYQDKRVYDLHSIQRKLADYDVISFDVFDTLIRRRLSCPADVFRILEKRSGVVGFAECRMKAEHAARWLKSKNEHSREVTLEEIYQAMMQDGRYADYSPQAMMQDGRYAECSSQTVMHADYSPQAVMQDGRYADYSPQAMMQAEFAIEKECCRADPQMLDLTEQMLAHGKKVIAVSDMYLHQAQILELLWACGYTGLKEIYVSSDCGAAKSDGRLFPRILQKTGPDKKLIHIGDNFYADVYRTKGLRMSAVHYMTERRG